MQKLSSYSQLYLRLALGAGYLTFGLDRLGVWGKYGSKGVSWGDWQHFMQYAASIMQFLPYSMAIVLAITATIAEIAFGTMLLVGLYTRAASIGSGILAFCFAVSMAISQGITSPMAASVFTVSAASFLLATVNKYRWGIDSLLIKNKPSV